MKKVVIGFVALLLLTLLVEWPSSIYCHPKTGRNFAECMMTEMEQEKSLFKIDYYLRNRGMVIQGLSIDDKVACLAYRWPANRNSIKATIVVVKTDSFGSVVGMEIPTVEYSPCTL